MTYKVSLTDVAKEDLLWLKKNEPRAFQKAKALIIELSLHPYTGTGKPKVLRHGFKGCYSRRITQKHRLVYSVDDEKITVFVLSASGHYADK